MLARYPVHQRGIRRDLERLVAGLKGRGVAAVAASFVANIFVASCLRVGFDAVRAHAHEHTNVRIAAARNAGSAFKSLLVPASVTIKRAP